MYSIKYNGTQFMSHLKKNLEPNSRLFLCSATRFGRVHGDVDGARTTQSVYRVCGNVVDGYIRPRATGNLQKCRVSVCFYFFFGQEAYRARGIRLPRCGTFTMYTHTQCLEESKPVRPCIYVHKRAAKAY